MQALRQCYTSQVRKSLQFGVTIVSVLRYEFCPRVYEDSIFVLSQFRYPSSSSASVDLKVNHLT